MNKLPTCLKNIIYKYEHQLKFNKSLDIIKNIKYTLNEDYIYIYPTERYWLDISYQNMNVYVCVLCQNGIIYKHRNHNEHGIFEYRYCVECHRNIIKNL